ncbi:MAG: ATP-grasp domain-containing protein [Planctomycetaceae bacterium]|nr:ATP-grasp domain-containing protein [Planctomycetaceae bacterium]
MISPEPRPASDSNWQPTANELSLLIVGASARAAAASAVRAGFQPISLDAFADLDTRRLGPTRQVTDYPAGLQSAMGGFASAPAMYVGGIENSIGVIDQLTTQHQLWGNTREEVLNARNPLLLNEVLKLARAPSCEWRNSDDPPPANGEWMLRPLAGSGGQGILPWDEEAERAVSAIGGLDIPYGFQQRIQGAPYSAIFVAAPQAGDVQFVGVTRQLVGDGAFGAARFQWCGNIGPVSLEMVVEHLIRRIGNILKWKAGLRGIFGIDFLLDDRGQPWVTEVNPRYPASTELLEWATGECLLWDHARCFQVVGERPEWQGGDQSPYFGKAIVYAPRDVTVPEFTPEWAEVFHPWQFPQVADIPAPGTVVPADAPLVSIFSMGASYALCYEKLVERAADVRAAFACD